MDGEIINLKKENVARKQRSKYGFERLNKVGNALRFVGKNQNQVLAAAMTLPPLFFTKSIKLFLLILIGV